VQLFIYIYKLAEEGVYAAQRCQSPDGRVIPKGFSRHRPLHIQ